MKSMTGYGRAMVECDGRRLTIELKSVNHRFLDISFRMPRTLNFMEDDARKLIGETLKRGHIDVNATYVNLRSDAKTACIDKALAAAYINALRELSDEMNLDNSFSAASVVRFPDVVTVIEAEEDRDTLSSLFINCLKEAINELVSMRTREGFNIQKDLENSVNNMEAMLAFIEERYPDTISEYTQRLKDRVIELIGDNNVDEQRLLQEVAIMADRSAIAEETVRFKSHISQIRLLFTLDEPIGRKLDFIVQELNREANTISSKSQDIPITNKVVAIKAEIEKFREQLQNIE